MSILRRIFSFRLRRLVVGVIGCVALFALPATVAARSAPMYESGIVADGSLQLPVPGVLRPEEGTIELTVRFSKPTSEFGNSWEFLFSTECANDVGPGGITLLGAFMPPIPEKGLTFLIRTGRGATYLNVPTFTCRNGEVMNLAFSWGKELRLYVNGVLKGRTAWSGPLDANMISPFLTVDRLGSFNPSQLRISTRERAAAELSGDSARSFVADDDTVVLADQNLAKFQLRTTRWHADTSYAFVLPVLRTEAQCYNEGDAIALPFLAVNYAPSPVTRVVSCTGRNAEGTEVVKRDVVLTIPPGGQHTVLSVPFPELQATGHFPLSLSVTGKTAPVTYPLAVAVIGRDDAGIKEGALGKYYGQHHNPEWDAAVWERMHVRASRAWSGIFTFLWWSVEPVEGEFDFRKSDAYVKQCRDAGMEVLGVLGYPSRWATIESSDAIKKTSDLAVRPERWAIRDLAAWKRYVYATVLRYKDQVQHWEIYNEVNFHPPAAAATYAGSTADYFELLKAAYAEAKRANPAAEIVLSGFSPFAERAMPTDLLAMGAADHCDIFATHAYSGSFNGIDRDWANAYWKVRPGGTYWQTEQMWHTLADDDLRAYKTVEIYVDFLVNRCARFFNMGDVGVFFDRNTKSPKVDYCAIAGVQQNIRLCDTYEGAYTFSGSDTFSLRHYFKRTDGLFLSILGSASARHELTMQGDIVAASDLLQRPVLPKKSGTQITLAQSSVLYVLSRQPLIIERAVSVGNVPVALRNGGFENYAGDDLAGIAKGKPLDWTLRDTSQDPQGTIVLTDQSRGGKRAMRIHSSGAGAVYVFQEVTLRGAGLYRLTAYFRAESASALPSPWLFVVDRNTGKTTGKRISASALVPGEFVRCDFDLNLPATGAAVFAIGFGISGGAGDVVLDDVSFTQINTATSDARITNLSILTSLAAADPVTIVGTVIGGAGTTGSKPLLVRAAGPSLAPFGITGTLSDPRLELFAGSTAIAGNDDWGGTVSLRSAFDQAGAFAFLSANSKDAAVNADELQAGAYTIQVTGVGGATGAVLIELYDGTPAAAVSPATPRLLNTSVRKIISTGGLLTAGFVITGTMLKDVLIRAVGPTLASAPFGVAGAMSDPRIQLFRGPTSIAANDNWGGGSELVAAGTSAGAFALPAVSRDAALFVTLPPGAYTAQVSGVGSSAGAVVVEIYEVPSAAL